MGEYYPFTEEQKERARRTDLPAFLQQCGETVTRSGTEYQIYSGGEKITLRGNVWYNQYTQEGGDAVAFVEYYYDYSYPDAVKLLLAMNCRMAEPALESYPKGDFKPPAAFENMHRVYAYLIKQRGISKEVVDAFTYRKLIYESYPYHNVVFAGYDKSGKLRHAHKRGIGKGSTYKGNAPSGDPEYSFHWVGTDDILCVFEAPIDLLSFICLHPNDWRKHSYAAACCVSDRVLWQMLQDYPQLKRIFLCFDSDKAGQTGAKRIQEKLQKAGIDCKILIPKAKDWNDQLLQQREAVV